ncbi:MAG: hypothetical protein LBH75_06980 [Treponema sp.]|jgi:hypothetical protein|nr:hypothetical protein [Treponema sp.]
MKRISVLFAVGLLAIGGIFAQTKDSTMYIAVKMVSLKSSAWAFAPSVKPALTYGTPVKILNVNGKWAEVQSVSLQVSGWMQMANLTSKRITATSSSTSASAKEIALAGKGFNEEVENTYKSENMNLDYNLVDEMEKLVIPDELLKNFIGEGHLKGDEEGEK